MYVRLKKISILGSIGYLQGVTSLNDIMYNFKKEDVILSITNKYGMLLTWILGTLEAIILFLFKKNKNDIVDILEDENWI